ncbi:3-isopropylmalate dehydrogenase [Sulfoacidibacillus thermotolerans]|uniref:3-isopropylmalate dehydrogenase n=1 Tax=Sulfoacidibacillus thermotolerans TaxID=1765684 RepID=A0A2U3DAN7_SULT2|nr:3-isopropylmalate dehydrogenase [Sulfoacidibacillus thermotolerans]PWI58325.1 3-isopropylmalate dehydrogenase [Sulfoacidibacillus thermotolerans]
MTYRVVLLPGDGIGPDVTAAAVKVLERAITGQGIEIKIESHLLGGCAIDETGTPFPEKTQEAVQTADAVILGAVGGPKWDVGPGHLRPEAGLLALRRLLGVYANIRPVKAFPELIDASPLRKEIAQAVDIVIVRELTGGAYFGKRERGRDEAGARFAYDTMYYSEEEIRRVLQTAFETARLRRKKLTSVDKANVLDSSRLWREIVQEMSAQYPDVTVEHLLVDACAMHLVTHPQVFDVLVTENLFGDILSDESAVLTGSIGMLPSASLGQGIGLYEPIHGSAPDIAGLGIANPLGAILSVALLLRYSLHLEAAALRVEQAVASAVRDGARTKDLARQGENVLTTEQMTERVLSYL